MNILMPVTLAAASLVLGTRSTSEGSCLLFFILQGRADSAVLQAEKHVQGKSWGRLREQVTSCSAQGPGWTTHWAGRRWGQLTATGPVCLEGYRGLHPPARGTESCSSQQHRGEQGPPFSSLQMSQGTVMS